MLATKRGRPRKYATAEEAKEANRLNASRRKRQRRVKEAQDLASISLHEGRAPDKCSDRDRDADYESTNACN